MVILDLVIYHLNVSFSVYPLFRVSASVSYQAMEWAMPVHVANH